MNRHHISRLAAITAGAGLAVLAAAPAAGADVPDLGPVRGAATNADSTRMAARFFVNQDARNVGAPLGSRAGAPQLAAKRPRVATDTLVAAYTLNPAFVAGTSAVPTLFNGYAVGLTSATGQRATGVLRETPRGWRMEQVSDGWQEIGYAAAAAGAPIFREPQINAWYALRGDTVVALNAAARQAVGARTRVADYQARVRQRYGDKLPGSAYERERRYGGYGATAAPARTDSHRVAWTVALAVAATAACGGVVALRRRRAD